MKKVVSLFLATVLCMALFGCGGGGSESSMPSDFVEISRYVIEGNKKWYILSENENIKQKTFDRLTAGMTFDEAMDILKTSITPKPTENEIYCRWDNPKTNTRITVTFVHDALYRTTKTNLNEESGVSGTSSTDIVPPSNPEESKQPQDSKNPEESSTPEASETAPSASSQKAPAQPTTNETTSQRNAVSKAKSYISFSAFSRNGLIAQLEYEKFSNEDSIYGADNCGANWNEQALKKAKSYLNHSAFSYKGLIDQLAYDKFETDQAKYGVDNCGADWNEQAAKKAESYLEFSEFSREGLIEQLEYEDFTHEQAVYGADANGL